MVRSFGSATRKLKVSMFVASVIPILLELALHTKSVKGRVSVLKCLTLLSQLEYAVLHTMSTCTKDA